MNFKQVKSLYINGMDVKTLSIGSNVVWRKDQPQPVYPPEETVIFYQNGTVLELNLANTIQQTDLPDIGNATKVIVGSAVTDIYYQTFANLPLLREVYINDSYNSVQMYHQTFVNSPSLRKVSIPEMAKFFCWSDGPDRVNFSNNAPDLVLTVRGKTQDQTEVMDFYPFGLEPEQIVGTIEEEKMLFSEFRQQIRDELNNQSVEILEYVYPQSVDTWAFVDNIFKTSATVYAGFDIDADVGTAGLFGFDSSSNYFGLGLGYEPNSGINSLFYQSTHLNYFRPFNLSGNKYYDIKVACNPSRPTPTSGQYPLQSQVEIDVEGKHYEEHYTNTFNNYSNQQGYFKIWRQREWTTYANETTRFHYLKCGSGGNVLLDLVPVLVSGIPQIYDRVSKQVIYVSGSLRQGPVVTTSLELKDKQIQFWNIRRGNLGVKYVNRYTFEDYITDSYINTSSIVNLANATDIATGSGITTINGTFSSARYLSTVKLEDVTTWTAGQFQNCTSLEEVYAPNVTPHLLDNTFYGCTNLKTVTLEKPVNVQFQTFSNCTSLESISLNALHFSSYCFAGCSNLKTIDLTKCNTVPVLAGSHWFDGLPADFVILVPERLFEEWITADNWKLDAVRTHIVADIPQPEESVAYYADGSVAKVNAQKLNPLTFENSNDIVRVVIGSAVTDVEPNTFADMSSLKEVYANDRPDDSVLQFYSHTFANSTALETVSLPASTRFMCWTYGLNNKDIFGGNESFQQLTIRGKKKEEIECMDFYPFGLSEDQIVGTVEEEKMTVDELKNLIKTSTGSTSVYICRGIRPETTDSYVVFNNNDYGWWGWNIQAGFVLEPTNETIAYFGAKFDLYNDDRTQTFIPALGFQAYNGVNQMFSQTSHNAYHRELMLSDSREFYHIKHQINRGKESSTSTTGTKWLNYLEMTGFFDKTTHISYTEDTKWGNPTKELYIWRMRDWDNYAQRDAMLRYFKGGYYGQLKVNIVPCNCDGEYQFFDLVTKTFLPKSGSWAGEIFYDSLYEEQRKLWNLK